MLYYCEHTWNPGTTREQVGRYLVEQSDAGNLRSDALRGYYGLVGGGAGFIIVDVDDPTEVNKMLTPSMHLMSWDVRALIPYNLDEDIAAFRQEFDGGSSS